MRIRHSVLLCSFCLGLILPAPSRPTGADATAPVHVSISKPLTPITDVLASLAKQTGQTILTDDTAVAPVGIADLQAPTLDDMLNSLKSLDAGLVWQKIYLPKDGALPTGTDLSAQVMALKSVVATGLILADPTGIVSFSRKKADIQVPPPADMRLVYLVSDETVRAQRKAAKEADAAAKGAGTGGTPVAQATSGLQGAADIFSQMTPDQQRQALPLMFDQFRRIMQGMDPAVRDSLRQQFGGRRGTLPAPGNGQ